MVVREADFQAAANYSYRVLELIRTVDGDTYDLRVGKQIDFGFYFQPRLEWSCRFRLYDFDTPERGQANWSEAGEFADTWIRSALLSKNLVGYTYKADSFGRWLIDLYNENRAEHLADALRLAGFETKDK